MKKLVLIFIMFLCFTLSAQDPIYQFKSKDIWWDNWSDSIKTYIWHSFGSQRSITSMQFSPQLGFDGLRQFFVEIDSVGISSDGSHFVINNYSKSPVFRKEVILDTTSAFNIFFVYETYLGEAFGWVPNDTLEWSLYGDTTRVETITILGLANEDLLYVSTFNPTELDDHRLYGIWQTDIPYPYRITGYFPAVIASDTNSVFLKFGVKDHTPNK